MAIFEGKLEDPSVAINIHDALPGNVAPNILGETLEGATKLGFQAAEGIQARGLKQDLVNLEQETINKAKQEAGNLNTALSQGTITETQYRIKRDKLLKDKINTLPGSSGLFKQIFKETETAELASLFSSIETSQAQQAKQQAKSLDDMEQTFRSLGLGHMFDRTDVERTTQLFNTVVQQVGNDTFIRNQQKEINEGLKVDREMVTASNRSTASRLKQNKILAMDTELTNDLAQNFGIPVQPGMNMSISDLMANPITNEAIVANREGMLQRIDKYVQLQLSEIMDRAVSKRHGMTLGEDTINQIETDLKAEAERIKKVITGETKLDEFSRRTKNRQAMMLDIMANDPETAGFIAMSGEKAAEIISMSPQFTKSETALKVLNKAKTVVSDMPRFGELLFGSKATGTLPPPDSPAANDPSIIDAQQKVFDTKLEALSAGADPKDVGIVTTAQLGQMSNTLSDTNDMPERKMEYYDMYFKNLADGRMKDLMGIDDTQLRQNMGRIKLNTRSVAKNYLTHLMNSLGSYYVPNDMESQTDPNTGIVTVNLKDGVKRTPEIDRKLRGINEVFSRINTVAQAVSNVDGISVDQARKGLFTNELNDVLMNVPPQFRFGDVIDIFSGLLEGGETAVEERGEAVAALPKGKDIDFIEILKPTKSLADINEEELARIKEDPIWSGFLGILEAWQNFGAEGK